MVKYFLLCFILIILNFNIITAQTTGFVQNFNDGNMTGWQSDHQRTFILSIDSTFLKITYTRTASSQPWDNFNLTLPNEIDVSNTPKLYVRAKSDVSVIIGLKPVPVNPVNVITNSIPGDGKWKDLFFEITSTTNLTVTQVYCYLDGGSKELKSGSVWFDEIRIGDSLLTLPPKFTNLEEAVSSAQALINSSTEGSGEGEFPLGSKANLTSALVSASAFLGTNATQPQIDSATFALYNACSIFESKVNAQYVEIVDNVANKQTRYLYLNLQDQMDKALLFGMHDATGYGVGWLGDDDRSDVKDVVGDYPAVYSEDLNNITRGTEIDRMRYRLTSAYRRGGIITLCWHQYDPDGRGFYAGDVNNEKIVSQILPGGLRHQEYLSKLTRVANFFKSLRGDNGEAIPIIFRPYHEHTGSWFWWGDGHCTTKEYNQLWQFTSDYLHDTLNVHNVLWAISPSFQHLGSGEEYFDIYPGDDYIDIFGGDKYFRTNPVSPEEIDEYNAKLHNIAFHAQSRNKIPALTEVGNPELVITDWFTEILLDPIKNNDSVTVFSYAAVWRNESVNHHYAPYPGHSSVPDFTEFFNDPYTLFERDLPDMYTLPQEDLTAPEFNSYPEEQFVSPSTSVEINIETNERAFLRWSYDDDVYDSMPNQFLFGERDFDHTTYIDAEQGSETTIYVQAADISDNKTNHSIAISFLVDTLQAKIAWNDARYPVDNWNYNNTSLGSGSEAENTINEVQTAYFVQDFELVSKPGGARSVVQFYGGLAIYINGVEAARENLPINLDLDYDTEATSTSKSTKSITFSAEIVDLMKAGNNRIAVEVHGGPGQFVEYFDALLQTDTGIPFNYGSEWQYYDSGDMPDTLILGEIVGIQLTDDQIPAKMMLYQNYPNPFNPVTTIQYAVGTGGGDAMHGVYTTSPVPVELSIYNILGQKIQTLVNEPKMPGRYETTFNNADLANGVYIYILKSGTFVGSKKMIYLK